MAEVTSALAWLGVLVLVVLSGVVGVVVVKRRHGMSRHVVRAGQDLGSSRAAAVGIPRPREDYGPRRTVLSKRAAESRDPWLTVPVVLAATWGHSVYHGSCETEGRPLVVRAATLRGSAHGYERAPGQDAAGVTWNSSRQSLFAMVADGLGSKRDSGQVSEYLVEQTMLQAEAWPPGKGIQELLELIAVCIHKDVARRELNGATTMVLAEIRPGRDGATAAVWGVGDSEAWYLRQGAWHPIHQERRDDGENVTRHWPGSHPPKQRPALALRPGCVLLLATDGFAAALGGGDAPLARELGRRWQKPPNAVDYLGQVDFVHPYFADDRTAVAVWIR